MDRFARFKKKNLIQTIGVLLVVFGTIGFLAAGDLSIEKVQLLKDPDYEPTCNISPILSCGSVMNTPQAEAFGFPNPFIGVASFAVVLTVGMGILAGAKYKRWFWLGLQAGTIFGVIFVHWLMYQSFYNIGALCPYCIVVWFVTIPTFLYVTLYNLRTGNIKFRQAWAKSTANLMARNHGNVLLVWYAMIILLILHKFWYYWKTLI